MELKKEENTYIDIKKIDLIIKNYDKNNLVPSSKAWEMWFSNFFNRINLNRNDSKFIERIKIFRDSVSFEESDFKEIFPELKYTNKYINPMSFELYNISKKECERLAFLIQEEAPFVDFFQLKLIIEYTFRGRDWNYKGFYKTCGVVSKELKRVLINQELTTYKKKAS